MATFEEHYCISGIKNQGAICYQSVLLQFLCNCDEIYNALNDADEEIIKKSNALLSETYVIFEMMKFIKTYGTEEELSTTKLLRRLNPPYDNVKKQQDVHEFAQYLFDAISNTFRKIPIPQNNEYQEPPDPIDLFRMGCSLHFDCTKEGCNFEDIKKVKELWLFLDPDGDTSNINNLINDFCSRERLIGLNVWLSSRKSVYRKYEI